MIRCLFGHKWLLIGKGSLSRNVDNVVVGSYAVLSCERCGKLKQKKFL